MSFCAGIAIEFRVTNQPLIDTFCLSRSGYSFSCGRPETISVNMTSLPEAKIITLLSYGDSRTTECEASQCARLS